MEKALQGIGWPALILAAFLWGAMLTSFFLACAGFAQLEGLGFGETAALWFTGVATLLLATVAIGQTFRAEYVVRRDQAAVRDEQAEILATGIEDEIRMVAMTLAEIRKEFRFAKSASDVNWPRVRMLIDLLTTPVIDGAFGNIFVLETNTAKFVARTRTQVAHLRSITPRFTDGELARYAMEMTLPWIIKAQRFATPAWRNILEQAVSVDRGTIPSEARVSDAELAIDVWQSGDMSQPPPPWPHVD